MNKKILKYISVIFGVFILLVIYLSTVGIEKKKFNKQEIKISAQAYLEKFYLDLGFERRGEGYMEDGIPHCAMFITP